MQKTSKCHVYHLLCCCIVFSLSPLFGSYYIYRGPAATEDIIPEPSILEFAVEGPNFFVKADYLYWTAKQIGLVVAASDSNLNNLLYPSWNAQSGFKLGMGSYLNHNGWEIEAEYTWFLNKNNEMTSSTNENQYLVAGMESILPVYQIDRKWENQFNRCDLTFGKTLIIGHNLSLKPFLGIVGAFENQWLTLKYKQETESLYTQNTLMQKWKGIGPYGGFLSLFNFSEAIKNNSISLLIEFGGALSLSNYKTTKKFTPLTPMLETTLGLAWKSWMGKNRNRNVTLSIAWEEQVWFNHNYLSINNDVSRHRQGDLILQGLTISGEIGF